MSNSPWEPSNDAQRAWIARWNHEQTVCKTCKKHGKCTAIDRMNTHVCQNLYERLGKHYMHNPA